MQTIYDSTLICISSNSRIYRIFPTNYSTTYDKSITNKTMAPYLIGYNYHLYQISIRKQNNKMDIRCDVVPLQQNCMFGIATRQIDTEYCMEKFIVKHWKSTSLHCQVQLILIYMNVSEIDLLDTYSMHDWFMVIVCMSLARSDLQNASKFNFIRYHHSLPSQAK